MYVGYAGHSALSRRIAVDDRLNKRSVRLAVVCKEWSETSYWDFARWLKIDPACNRLHRYFEYGPSSQIQKACSYEGETAGETILIRRLTGFFAPGVN
jgi:hypothetical protein